MAHVIYYSPTIPTVESTARYAHAAAFPDHVERTTLVTEQTPPPAIEAAYDDVQILDGWTLRKARRAASIADGTTGEDTLYVTTFHYAPALSGFLADTNWVVDLYDDPHQYALNNPRSHHQLTARALSRVIGRADGVIHDYHPHAGRVLGSDPRFMVEGCPSDLIDPVFEPPEERLGCVWAGSPRMDRGMNPLLHALHEVEVPAHVDVYGDHEPEVTAMAERIGVTDAVTFHGQTEHGQVLEAIANAQVGLCVLPERSDWLYATPLKVREYMAGGTVPVTSPFPGMRRMAEGAAVYTDPDPSALAGTFETLDEIANDDENRFVEKMRRGRRRAEMLSLADTNEWFVRQCLSSGLGLELF